MSAPVARSISTPISAPTARPQTAWSSVVGTATGSTGVRITNVGGPGAETTANGILVVQTTNNASTAADAFHLDEEVRAGFYTYDLFRGGLARSDSQDWFCAMNS